MAEGLNKCMLLGNLGADPDLKITPGGSAVLKLRLATSETYMDRNKEKQEKTEWHTVVIWGRRAEALAKILTKGSRIFVEGGLQTSSYDDRDGNKRYKTEVKATNILLQGGGRDRRDTEPAGSGYEYGDAKRAKGSTSGDGESGDFPAPDDDDIPF